MATTVIVVHGMGTHTEGQISAKFKQGISAGLRRLQMPDSIIEAGLNSIDFREFYYDGILDEHRKQLAENARGLRDNNLSVSSWMSLLYSRVGKMDELLGEDNAFTQSWLDVALYCHSFLGEKLRVELASMVCKAIKEARNHRDVHLVAHSLGTAVTHDTLHKLFRDETDFRDSIPDFPVGAFNLGSVTMVANVSRLTNLISYQADPYRSRCTSGLMGCTDSFINVSHKYDPFLWPRPYSALGHPHHAVGRTVDVETSAVHSWNPHDFGNYVAIPEVALRLYADFIPEDVSEYVARLPKATRTFNKDTVAGAAAELKRKMRKVVRQQNVEMNFKEVYQLLKNVYDELAELKSTFELDNGGGQ